MRKNPTDTEAIAYLIDRATSLTKASRKLGLLQPSSLSIWRLRRIPADQRFKVWTVINQYRKQDGEPLLGVKWLAAKTRKPNGGA
jgi:hypothetical protein